MKNDREKPVGLFLISLFFSATRDVASAVRDLRLTFNRSCLPIFKSGTVVDLSIDPSRQAREIARTI